MLRLPYCILGSKKVLRFSSTLPAYPTVGFLGRLRRLAVFLYKQKIAVDLLLWGLFLYSNSTRRLCEWPFTAAVSLTGSLSPKASWFFYIQAYWFRFVVLFLGVPNNLSLNAVWQKLSWVGQSVFMLPPSSSRGRGVYVCLDKGTALLSDGTLVSAGIRARNTSSVFKWRKSSRRLVLVPLRRRRLLRGRSISTFFISSTNQQLGYYRTRLFVRRASRWFRVVRSRKRKRRSRHFYLSRIRKKLFGFSKVFPAGVARRYRFVRKFRALFTVRAQHTNLFFTIRQGSDYFLASTGMFEDLKHGTKRKRTLLAGWFLADRLFERVHDALKEKTIFQVDLYGRTSGRRGVWFSWRTKPWRLFLVRSRTPIAYNGTRGCRRRRL